VQENGKAISVGSFQTERNYDKLFVNGEAFSGSNGPAGKIPTTGVPITWTSDYSVTSAGWKICLPATQTEAPTTTTTTTAAPTMPPAWNVTKGACAVDGNCVTSPNFPSNYSVNQGCSISVQENGKAISVGSFQTERNYDKLFVNGEAFSGSNGPAGKVPTTGLPITWTSDHSVPSAGWKICLEGGVGGGSQTSPTGVGVPVPPGPLGPPGPSGQPGPPGPPLPKDA